MSNKNKMLLLGIGIIFSMLACNLSGSTGNQSSDNDNEPTPSQNNNNENDVAEPTAPTATFSPVPPTNTAIPPTPVPTDDTVTVQVSVDTNCRSGPRIDYMWIGAVTVGETVEAIKRPPGSEPYLVVVDSLGECWVWLEYATVFGDPSTLPIAAIPATPTPIPPSSIQGVVWLDLCSSGAPGDPPQGCLEGDPNVYYGNGLLEPGEFGIAGITVDLGEGACPATGYDTAITDGNGIYNFADVPASDYCLSIDVFSHGNDSELIPGGWVHPLTNDTIAKKDVTVNPGEDLIQQHFGWDFQFD